MLFSSISPFHSTISDLYVQPTISSDVQSLHSYDANASPCQFPVTATSSDATGTCTVRTLFPNPTMSGHSFTTVVLTCIHGPCIRTTTKPSGLTYRLYQGIRL